MSEVEMPIKAEEIQVADADKSGEETVKKTTSRQESLHAMPELMEKEAAEKAEQAIASGDTAEYDIGAISIDDALNKFKTSREGLSSAEAAKRLEEYGPNALPEKEVNKCLQFLSFMWNPLSWVMEMAAIVAIILSNGTSPFAFCGGYNVGSGNLSQSCFAQFGIMAYFPTLGPSYGQPPDYPDFVGIIILLLLNSAIGYVEESAAGDAVAALMESLSPECKCKRDGKWETIDAKSLVPGDIITIKLGDIIPADCKVLEGVPLKVDQAGLTGESLPVTKEPGDEVYSSCIVKRGEIDCMVHATGINTFFGKAASLVAQTEEHGHLQIVLTSIGNFCIAYISLWIFILIVVVFGVYQWAWKGGIDMVLVLLIGGIPIAMPTVLSVTMALGVNALAKQNAIVTRITAVEELAGMDILCSDKTGTLTLNQLTVDTPSCASDKFTPEDVIRVAALAAKKEGDPDAIDKCIHETAVQQGVKFEEWKETHFIPFDPVGKKTESTVVGPDGVVHKCSKGAPQVCIDMAHNADEIRAEQNKIIDDFALRGLRAIGVATQVGDGPWEFMGLIPLLDPPRHDTKQTIEEAQRLGVRVKMITGDQVAIGKETARRLGMGMDFHKANVVRLQTYEGKSIEDVVEDADGFGEVFPEDKYAVVEILRHIQGKGPFGGPHVVGMTGDGVNDAPALKASDVGIAVADATDAARAAADMVLLTPGLNVIIQAIIGSRKIFQRMKNYAVYACATTVRVVTTFALLAVVWQFSFPPFMVLIIAYLNDGTILTISKDNASPSPTPDAWRLKEIFVTGFCLGSWLTISTIVFFIIIIYTDFFETVAPQPPKLMGGKIDDICPWYQMASTGYSFVANAVNDPNSFRAPTQLNAFVNPDECLSSMSCLNSCMDSIVGGIGACYLQASVTTALNGFVNSNFTNRYTYLDVQPNPSTATICAPPPAAQTINPGETGYWGYAAAQSGSEFGYCSQLCDLPYDSTCSASTVFTSPDAFKSSVSASASANCQSFSNVNANNFKSYCQSNMVVSQFGSSNTVMYDPMNNCQAGYIGTYGYSDASRRLNAVIYLQVSITGQMVIFSTRARLFFFMDQPSYYLMGAFLVAQLVATFLVVYADWPFTAIQAIGWGWAAIAWVWSIVWYLPLDLIKMGVYGALYGNPWAHMADHKKMLNLALNGGASNLGSRAGSRTGNSQAFARASAARAGV
jgi:H+-transporting ATPase